MPAELVVSDQRAEWVSAESAILFLVDLLEHLALIEFYGLIEVLEQIRLTDVHQLDLEAAGCFGLHHEVLQAAPRTFQLLERFGMYDLVQLLGNQGIQVRDTAVQQDRKSTRL